MQALLKQTTRTLTNSTSRIRSSNTMDSLLIPGPVILNHRVLNALNTPSVSHTSPEFTKVFQNALRNCRRLHEAHESKGTPLIISGAGTLGWDLVGANLLQPNDNKRVLVISTGYFSEAFADCLEAYGAEVTRVKAALGQIVPLNDIEDKLKETKFNSVVITHVDTSTAVRNDVEGIAQIVRKHAPDTFIVVDGVCSIGCEKFKFHDWGIDFSLTAPQKAIGSAPGLSICMLSERVKQAVLKARQTSYFTSLKRWIPVMEAYEQGKPMYFSTQPIQLIYALDAALTELLEYGLEERWNKHAVTSQRIKDQLTNELGFQLLHKHPSQTAAVGLTAVYVPDASGLLSYLKKNHIVIASGLLPNIKDKYVRIGHMGCTVCDPEYESVLPRCLELIKKYYQRVE